MTEENGYSSRDIARAFAAGYACKGGDRSAVVPCEVLDLLLQLLKETERTENRADGYIDRFDEGMGRPKRWLDGFSAAAGDGA